MPIREVHHVALSVADLDRSLAFYRDLLGFRVTVTGGDVGDEAHRRYMRIPEGTTGRAATVQPKGSVVGAIELIEFHLPYPVEPTGPKQFGDPGMFMLAFEVVDEELGDVCRRLSQAGVEFWSEPEELYLEDLGRLHAVVCEDPDGVLVELLSLPTLEEIRALRRSRRSGRAVEA